MHFTTLIDVDTLRAQLGGPQLALIDCRFDLSDAHAGRRAYLEGHLPGAVYADLERDLASPRGPQSGRHPLPPLDGFAKTAGLLGIGPDTQVVAYDASSGAYAARLWWMLRWAGHEFAAVLDGGLAAWTASGAPLEAGAVTPTPRLFTARPSSMAVVSTHELENLLGKPGETLFDARAAPRFAGSAEPIDPVAGHVPGAINHPFTANLGADGRFLPAAELRRRWLALLGPGARAISMCGSGVTACHNLLALEIAGLGSGALYAGSWSEWIRDPGRPVARG